jgi:hypothetical protein
MKQFTIVNERGAGNHTKIFDQDGIELRLPIKEIIFDPITPNSWVTATVKIELFPFYIEKVPCDIDAKHLETLNEGLRQIGYEIIKIAE